MRDKRRYPRAELSTVVTVTAANGTRWTAESRDVSLGGIFLAGLTPVPIGTEVGLEFSLPLRGALKVPAFVRWSTPHGFGLQFGLLGARETHALGEFMRQGGDTRPAH